MVQVLSCFDRERTQTRSIKITVLTFLLIKSKMTLSGCLNFFLDFANRTLTQMSFSFSNISLYWNIFIVGKYFITVFFSRFLDIW